MGSYLSAAIFVIAFIAGLLAGLMAGVLVLRAARQAGSRRKGRKDRRKAERRRKKIRKRENREHTTEEPDEGHVPLRERMINKNKVSSWVDFNCTEDGIDEDQYISGSRRKQNSSYKFVQKRGVQTDGTEKE